MTRTKSLRLAKGLTLSLDFATKTAAILAQRRKGKTYTASVIAEEMVAAKQPFVALDPTGAWWGLRADAGGKREGLPVVVLGGQHGDVPLERTGGRLIAELVVEEPGYYVIDFSLFESGEAERQFAVDFAERLYRAKGQAGKDFPLHLFVDEADRFIPQQMRKGSGETSPRLLGAFEAIVRRGGLRGLGTTLISQRAAVVNKNVLEMLDVLIVLRTVGPNDQAAILGYIKAHGTDAERVEMMGSLASLDIGEAWVWEPGAEPPLFQRVRIRPRHTFNSSATPKAGEKRVEPKRLADVDLAALQTRMAETVEKAKAEDPRELRRTIADLHKQLAAKQPPPAPAVKGKRVEILTDSDRALLEKVTSTIRALDDQARRTVTEAGDATTKIVQKAIGDYLGLTQDLALQITDAMTRKLETKGFQKILSKLATVAPVEPAHAERPPTSDRHHDRAAGPRAPHPRAAARADGGRGAGAHRGQPAASTGAGELNRMHRAMLIALAQHPKGLTKKQIHVHTGYASSGSTSAAFADLVRNEWVDPLANLLRITPVGLKALGDFEPLPLGDELRAWLLAGDKLSTMEKALLERICVAYPASIAKGEILQQAKYASSGSTSAAFAKLVAYNYAIPQGASMLKAAEELFS